MHHRPGKRLAALTLAAAAAVAPLLTAAPAKADVTEALDAAPQGAQLVVVVPSLQRLSDAAATLNTELQLNNPMLADLLASMKSMGGMRAGLDDDGSAMFVMPTLMSMAMGGQQPPMLLMIPVSDYEAFVGNFGGAAQGGVTRLTMPGGGQPGYARHVGGFAVMSPLQPLVANYQPGHAGASILEKVGPAGEAALTDAAIAAYVDVETVAPMLLPMIDMGLNMAKMQAQQQAQANPQMAQAAQWMDVGGSAIRTVMSGMRGVTLALGAGDAGLEMTLATQMVDGSNLARALPGGAARGLSILDRVPAEPYLLAAGYDTRAIDFAYMMRSMAALMPEGEEAQGMAQLYRDMLPMAESMNAAAMGWYLPEAADAEAAAALDPKGFYRTVWAVDADNPADAMEVAADYIASMNGLEMPLGPDMRGNMMNMSYQTSVERNALRVSGQDVGTFSVQTIYPEQLAMQMGPMAGVMQTFGSYDGYLAATDTGYVMTTVRDAGLLEKTFTVEDGQGLAAHADVRAAAEHLPADPVAVTLVGIDGVVDMMSTMGMPMPAGAPLGPIAMGFAVDDNAGDLKVHVPYASARFIGQAAQQAMMMMMMGGAPMPMPEDGGQTY